jgi:hypothetical protein
MGINLKAVYDAAKAADEKVNAVLTEMTAAFEEGTEEGKQKALALRPALESAKVDARQANDLYVEMRDARSDSDEHARKFVPVNQAAAKAGQTTGKTVTRAEFDAMDHGQRRTFLLQDKGTVVDELAE